MKAEPRPLQKTKIHHNLITKTRRWYKGWKVNREMEKGRMVMQRPVGECNLTEGVCLLSSCGKMVQWSMILPARVSNVTWV